jgi:hypothetical protein
MGTPSFSARSAAALAECGGRCPIEAGLFGRLADHECRHGWLPCDRTPPCGCWPVEGGVAPALPHPSRVEWMACGPRSARDSLSALIFCSTPGHPDDAERRRISRRVVNRAGAPPRKLRLLHASGGLVVFVSVGVPADLTLAEAHDLASASRTISASAKRTCRTWSCTRRRSPGRRRHGPHPGSRRGRRAERQQKMRQPPWAQRDSRRHAAAD